MKYIQDSSLFIQAAVIGDEYITSPSSIPVFNPATGEVLGHIPNLSREECKRAILVAEKGFTTWKQIPAKERSKILKEWFRLVMQNQEDLAFILTQEQGKPLTEARGEIAYAASYIEWFSEEAKRVYGDVIPSHRFDTRILILKEPVGVVATITPWNFPSAMLARKVAAALAVGCSVVSKPSELTPFSALALHKLALKAGLPSGVWNIVMGDYVEIGKEFCENPIVKKISFTGSTQTGALLMAQSASTVKRLSLELGGNAPFIVFEDADIDKAVRGAILSKYRNSGQTCVCVNRFYVQESIAEEFSRKLAHKSAQLKVGNGLEEGVEQGPLINLKAVEKVETHIEDALAKGAKLLCGGKRHHLGNNFFEPTVLYGIHSNMQICQEETFGPVSGIQTFQTEQEVLRLANHTPYGLAAYFYSKDISRIWRIAEGLEVGMIGINEAIISSEQIPFGGVKQSGFGREGSKYGIEDYLNLKYLCIGLESYKE